MPPFSVRNATKIETDLGLQATVSGYVSIPIYTYINASFNDDIKRQACPFVSNTNNIRWVKDSSFTNVLDTIPSLSGSYASDFKDVFNNTAQDFSSMQFIDFEGYTDMVFAEVFEGYNT